MYVVRIQFVSSLADLFIIDHPVVEVHEEACGYSSLRLSIAYWPVAGTSFGQSFASLSVEGLAQRQVISQVIALGW
jgi:hypothetical protein